MAKYMVDGTHIKTIPKKYMRLRTDLTPFFDSKKKRLSLKERRKLEIIWILSKLVTKILAKRNGSKVLEVVGNLIVKGMELRRNAKNIPEPVLTFKDSNLTLRVSESELKAWKDTGYDDYVDFDPPLLLSL